MDEDILDYWRGYHCLYPIDRSEERLRHAVLCRLIAATAGNKTDIEDWIMKFGQDPEPMNDLEAFKAGFECLTAK